MEVRAWCYLVGCERDRSIKIGHTDKDPLTRLRQLQTGNAGELQLLHALPAETTAAAHQLESQLHQLLRPLHIRGEWFDWNEEMERHLKLLRMGLFAPPPDPQLRLDGGDVTP